MPKKITLSFFYSVFLLSLIAVVQVQAWSNGGFSSNPSSPDYGTHDWIAQHALDWLPTGEKQYILDNLAAYLYGTELPDNNVAPDGIGDTIKHHIYFSSAEIMVDDAAATRASSEYLTAVNFLSARDYVNASKKAGVMSHYIADLAVFGDVMGAGTDWGAEVHHSDYEAYVNDRTSAYDAEFNSYLSFDGDLTESSAYDAAKNLAFDTTFDIDGDLTCVWMDTTYNWSDLSFKNRCGESLNLAVNYLADVLHTLYLEANPEITPIIIPRDYATIQEAVNAATAGSIIHVEHGIYGPFTVNKSLTIIGECSDNTIIDGNGAGTAVAISADNVCMRGFKIQNGNNGIEIANSRFCTVSSNELISTDRGIFLSSSHEITVENNIVENNNYGIALDLSNKNTIARNKVSRNSYGIDMRYSQNNTVAWNNIISNVDNGLVLYHTDRNMIMCNLIKTNGQNGAYFQHSFDNTLFHNNIINNTNQLYQYDSTNLWSMNFERLAIIQLEGNYWGDYAGSDTDSDGIGETLLPHQGVDSYPLMSATTAYPSANFTLEPRVQLVNNLVSFNASASFDEDGSITDFTWNFGDRNITVTQSTSITHRYTSYGTYTVTLVVTDNERLSDSSRDSAVLTEPPSASFTLYPRTPLIAETVTFNASASVPNGGFITSYLWNFGDGRTGATAIAEHAYATSGTQIITLTVMDTEGLSDTASQIVRIYARPVALFTHYPNKPNIFSPVEFNASTSKDEDGLITNYTWNFGDGNTTTWQDNIIAHKYVSFGNYTVTLTITDNDALTNSFARHVMVYSTPTAIFTYNPESPATGETITFNASPSMPNGGNIVDYSWDFNGDGIADAHGMIVNHTFSSQGNYVTLTVTNEGGLTHTTAVNLTATAPPGAGLMAWLQSPIGIAALVGGTATIAIGVPVLILKRRKPPPLVAAPPLATPLPIPLPGTPSPPEKRPEKGPKAVITVSKTNGEYTVMVEGPENYPVKLKHQLKVDDQMKRSLIQDFDTTALIANYWTLSRSGRPKEKLPSVPTLDINVHLERSGRLMYRYLTPANVARFFKTARIDHLWLEIDESLLEIPWELMHDGDDFICLKYAVGRRILTGQIYEAKPPRIIQKPRFLLIGDPSEELPDAKKEIQLLEKQLKKLPNVEVDCSVGSAMTKADFLQTLCEGKYDCIHFAGHAGFDVEKPDESYLKFGDGLCYAFETKRLVDEENPPEIVFVNACSSAKEAGQTTFEKEIGGLARAFLFRGSMGYIGALWPVHDEAVAQLSLSFYTKLVSGLTIGEALRQARKESFSVHKGKEIAWASFTLYGDPNLTLL